MNTLRIGMICVALTLLMGAPALAQTGHDLLQQALVMEQAEGNLQAAIQLYERIVQEFGGDGPLAARALVQMGQCYEKLGSQEAERAYQRRGRARSYPEYLEAAEFLEGIPAIRDGLGWAGISFRRRATATPAAA